MTPRLPVSAAPVTRDLHDGRADLRRDRDRRRRLIDGDRLDGAGVGAAAGEVDARGRSIEGADGVEREDRATRCQDRGQERGRDQRPRRLSPSRRAAVAGAVGGRRRRGLVPALGGDGRDLVPGSSPVGARFGGRRVAVAAGLRRGRSRGPRLGGGVRLGGGRGRLDRCSGRLDRGARTAGSTGGTAWRWVSSDGSLASFRGSSCMVLAGASDGATGERSGGKA